MAIVIDAPVLRGRRRKALTAHLLSTKSGRFGEDELLHFNTRHLGLNSIRLHRQGTHKCHFDLMSLHSINRAISAGARQISRRELGDLLRAKRRYLEHRAANIGEIYA